MNAATAEDLMGIVDEPKEKTTTRIFKGQLFRVRKGHGFGFSDEAPQAAPEPVYRPARVARLLALAHRLEAAIDGGQYVDRADIARKHGLTRGRLTQILDLMLLAPDIQERVLNLESIDGREPLSERALRRVLRDPCWAGQRVAFAVLLPQG